MERIHHSHRRRKNAGHLSKNLHAPGNGVGLRTGAYEAVALLWGRSQAAPTNRTNSSDRDKMRNRTFPLRREIERVNHVPLTASKGSLSEGAVSRRLTEGVPKVPAGLRRTPSVTASPCHLPLGGRLLDPGRSQLICSFNYPALRIKVVVSTAGHVL